MGGGILLYYCNSSENLNHLQYTDDMRSEIEFQGFDKERNNIIYLSVRISKGIFSDQIVTQNVRSIYAGR